MAVSIGAGRKFFRDVERQLKALRKEIPATVAWRDLHPGVAEWVRKRNNEERLHQGRMKEMTLEWYIVFRYCENSERAAQADDEDAAIEKLLAMQSRYFDQRGI